MVSMGQRAVTACVCGVLALGCLAGCDSGSSTAGSSSQAEPQASQQEQSSVEQPSPEPAPTTQQSEESHAEPAPAPAQQDDPATSEAAKADDAVVDCGAFVFELPTYWQGRVQTVVGTSDAGTPQAVVSLPGSEKAILATLTLCTDGEQPQIAGDIGNHLVGHVGQDGQRVEVWTRNWPWLVGATSTYAELGEDVLRELVDLSTGGAMSYEDALATGGTSSSGTEAEFSASVLVPTVAFR